MRQVALLLALFAGALPSLRASTLPSAAVTVLLKFDQDHSAVAMREMEKELGSLFKSTGYRFEWKLMEDVGSSQSFDDLVVVRMKGRCAMESYPLPYDERGPLAFTHSSDGQLLPFSEVDCDKVRHSVQQAWTAADRSRGEQVLGRALARVLAHELYHIFAKTSHHGQEGIARTALSARQLVAEKLEFDAPEIHALLTRKR